MQSLALLHTIPSNDPSLSSPCSYHESLFKGKLHQTSMGKGGGVSRCFGGYSLPQPQKVRTEEQASSALIVKCFKQAGEGRKPY